MKVLIIGSNARTGSDRYCTNYVTMAGVIRDSLRAAGHTVAIHSDWWGDSLSPDEWDMIYVGIASPLSAASSYVYSALRAIGQLWWDDRLRLFVDDPDVRVIKNALNASQRNPEKTWAGFLNKRRHHAEVVESADIQREIGEALDMLTDTASWWPRLFVPAYPWADVNRLMSSFLPVNPTLLTGVDLTPAVLGDGLVALDHREKDEKRRRIATEIMERDELWSMRAYWIAETSTESWALAQSLTVTKPVRRLSRMKDWMRITMYEDTALMGVMEGDASPYGTGWWTPRMGMAAKAGAFYTTDMRTLDGMRYPLPYVQYLPGAYEELTDLERRTLVLAQKEALTASTWSAEELQDTLIQQQESEKS